MPDNLQLWLESAPGPKTGKLHQRGGREWFQKEQHRVCKAAGITRKTRQGGPAEWGVPTTSYFHNRIPLVGAQAVVEIGMLKFPRTPLHASVDVVSNEACVAYWSVVPAGTDQDVVASLQQRIRLEYMTQMAPGGAAARFLEEARREPAYYRPRVRRKRKPNTAPLES